jgi:hypothetical protein
VLEPVPKKCEALSLTPVLQRNDKKEVIQLKEQKGNEENLKKM